MPFQRKRPRLTKPATTMTSATRPLTRCEMIRLRTKGSTSTQLRAEQRCELHVAPPHPGRIDEQHEEVADAEDRGAHHGWTSDTPRHSVVAEIRSSGTAIT